MMIELKRNPLSYAVLIGIYTLTTQTVAAEGVQKKDVVDLGTTVVTGQKINRTLQETTDSVTVYTETELEEKVKTDDFYDLLDQTPNIGRTSSYEYTIRGINTSGATGSSNGAPRVGFLVDDAVVGRRATQSGAVSLWDTESVEILRGPQSTTSGRNSLAGQFVVKTKDPEFNNSGQARISYGEYNTYQLGLAQNLPITDNLAMRIAVDHRHTDNFSNNPTLNRTDWDEEFATTIRSKFLYKTDNSKSVLTLSHVEFDDRGNDNVIGNANSRAATENYASTWITDNNIVSFKHERDLTPQWSLTSNTAFSSAKFDRDSDADNQYGMSVISQDTDEDHLNQEFLFNYDGDKLKSVVGLYLAKGKLHDTYNTQGLVVPVQLFNPQAPASTPPLAIDLLVTNEEDYKNAALFFNADYKLTPKLTLISGLRIDYEDRETYVLGDFGLNRSTGNPALDAQLTAGLAGFGGQRKADGDNVNYLPKLGFNYAFTDNLSAGFVAQRGYNPGGISANPVRGTTTEFEPEFTNNYELSLRTQSADKRYTFNANVFYTDWEDQQVSVQRSPNPIDETIYNASSSTSKGFELTGSAQVTPNLRLHGAVGHLKTKFNDFQLPAGVNSNLKLSGKEFRFARDWTGNIGADYFFDNGMFVTTQVNYLGDAFAEIENTNVLKAATTWDAKFGYEMDHVTLSAYLKNITNKEYLHEFYNRSVGGASYIDNIYGEPRQFGVSADFKW